MLTVRNLLRPRRVHAHCDIPCGVYDPEQARIEAESCLKIIEKYEASDDPVFRARCIDVKEKRAELYAPCDQALREFVQVLEPGRVVGVGAFAEKRAREALADFGLTINCILHPSPASPKANRGWEKVIEAELAAAGVELG